MERVIAGEVGAEAGTKECLAIVLIVVDDVQVVFGVVVAAVVAVVDGGDGGSFVTCVGNSRVASRSLGRDNYVITADSNASVRNVLNSRYAGHFIFIARSTARDIWFI